MMPGHVDVSVMTVQGHRPVSMKHRVIENVVGEGPAIAGDWPEREITGVEEVVDTGQGFAVAAVAGLGILQGDEGAFEDRVAHVQRAALRSAGLVEKCSAAEIAAVELQR